MQFTTNNLRQIFPATPRTVVDAFVSPLNLTCERYSINTVARASAFIAQIGHESAGLTATRENLNYSAAGLIKIFGKYFTPALAERYARKPQAIASKVYSNRFGNGDEASGDGWTYRGRGLIQVTFKSNYEALAKALGMTLADVLTYLETPEGAAMSAGWYWDSRDLNPLADRSEITNMTKKINGGVHGLNERLALWRKAKAVLA